MSGTLLYSITSPIDRTNDGERLVPTAQAEAIEFIDDETRTLTINTCQALGLEPWGSINVRL